MNKQLIAANQVYINLSLKMFVQLFFELKPNLSTSLIKMQKVLSNVSNVCWTVEQYNFLVL